MTPHDERLASLHAFALAWEAADTVAAAAKATGMNERAASNLAANLRRRKVPLKNMKNVRAKGVRHIYLTQSEWDELRRIVHHNAVARETAKRYRSRPNG